MSLTVVTKYKKDGRLFIQFSTRGLNDQIIAKIKETISSKYKNNESFAIVNERDVINFNIEFHVDDSLESNSYINAIQSILDTNT